MTFPLDVPSDYGSNMQVRLRVVDSEATFGTRNAHLVDGKFYPHTGGPDHEVKIATIDEQEFSESASTTVNACNRDGALVGTEGSFDISRRGEKVASVRWDIPIGVWGPPNQPQKQHHPPLAKRKPTVAVTRHKTKEQAYDLDVEGLQFERYQEKWWRVETSGTISLKAFSASCLLKIRNDLPERVVFARVSHHQDISRPYDDGMMLIWPDSTTDWLIGISDDRNGELHLYFSDAEDLLDIDPDFDADSAYGTFKCDNLRSPSDKNAIGNPAKRIDVTSTTFDRDKHTSEIHIHVR